VRFRGAVTYEWQGQPKHAVSSWPDVVIGLYDEWVTVGRIGLGTELVPWESVRDLSGWSVAEGDR
jgi:hypothetical protein